MPILQYPRHSLSDQTNSHGLVRCRSDRDRGSPAFVKFDDVRIEPGTIVDIFPGEQFVIARGTDSKRNSPDSPVRAVLKRSIRL